jgi:flagellar protein FlbD
MVELNRLGAHGEPVWVNPDLIATIEAHPDTVLVLTTGTKVVVSDSIDEVVDSIRAWRVGIARGALKPHAVEPTNLV